MGEALDEIENERRLEVHGANERKEKYSEREKEIQVRRISSFLIFFLLLFMSLSQDLEKMMSEARRLLETVAQSRRDTQAKLTDLRADRAGMYRRGFACRQPERRGAGGRITKPNLNDRTEDCREGSVLGGAHSGMGGAEVRREAQVG